MTYWLMIIGVLAALVNFNWAWKRAKDCNVIGKQLNADRVLLRRISFTERWDATIAWGVCVLWGLALLWRM